jgi:HEAT repeat protein
MYGQPPISAAHERRTVERAAEAVMLGLSLRLDRNATRALGVFVESDPEPRVRTAALGALVRAAPKVSARAAWKRATGDRDASVRRRAAELAPLLGTRATRTTMVTFVLALLDDDDVLVAEAAAFALGELASRAPRDDACSSAASRALAHTTVEHPDPLAREAAVAALGAIGDPATLPAVLAATRDKPAVRRRAVLALAAFGGPEVEAAIEAARSDTDWQVRQAAEDLS